jgi:hypothetical protein
MSYGYAAGNQPNFACGHCYELKFTGSSNNAGTDDGSQSLSGKSMIVQVVNIGGIQSNQLDIMIPGGGVGANNACTSGSSQWGSSTKIGAQNGGMLSQCKSQSTDYSTYKSCVLSMCTAAFGGSGMSDLLAGCDWFVNWYGAADNPNFNYTEVSCPSAINSVSGM